MRTRILIIALCLIVVCCVCLLGRHSQGPLSAREAQAITALVRAETPETVLEKRLAKVGAGKGEFLTLAQLKKRLAKRPA
jgi:hypothetical protein